MAIKLKIRDRQQEIVMGLGAQWDTEETAWVIPDDVEDLNPFKEWLPQQEGFIVRRPHFVARAKRACYRCGKETPVVTLAARIAHQLIWETDKRSIWQKVDYPILFMQIDYVDEEVIKSLQSYYPFFQRTHSEIAEGMCWGSRCIHCGAFQEEDEEFTFGMENPFAPFAEEQAREIRVIYFKLKFDYFISAGWSENTWYGEVIK